MLGAHVHAGLDTSNLCMLHASNSMATAGLECCSKKWVSTHYITPVRSKHAESERLLVRENVQQLMKCHRPWRAPPSANRLLHAVLDLR